VDDPAGRSTFRVVVAGLVLEVRAASPVDRALVQRVVGHAYTTLPADGTVTIDGTGPPVPSSAPDYDGGFGEHWDDGSVHAFRHPWGFSARLTDRTAVIGGPAAGVERWIVVRFCLFFVMARMMAADGRFLLHGGAVRRGDHALLIVGDSGTGKSSLAFAAHCAGWSVLADDMAVVDTRGSLFLVSGIPRAPAVPRDVASGLADTGDPVPEDDRERIELTELALDPRPAAIVATVFTAHDPGPGRLVEITTSTALQRLVPALVLSSLPRPVRAWFPHAAALARGRCFELRHAADPGARLARAAELLDEVLDAVAADPSAQEA
jgi:hypothetical protein